MKVISLRSAPLVGRPVALPPLDAVLFDAGGTLVRIDYEFVAASAAKVGVSLDDASMARGEATARCRIDARAAELGAVEGSDATRVPQYFRTVLEVAGVPNSLMDDVLHDLVNEHAAKNLWRVPVDGAEATLDGLRAAGTKTAVVSNADGRIRSKLERLGLAQRVEFVIDSFEEGVEKPDPEIFRRALERLGVSANRAAYVGDIYSIDAVGARNAGLHPILLDPTGAYRDADCLTVARLTELIADRVPPGS